MLFSCVIKKNPRTGYKESLDHADSSTDTKKFCLAMQNLHRDLTFLRGDSENLKSLDNGLGEVGAKRHLNGASQKWTGRRTHTHTAKL